LNTTRQLDSQKANLEKIERERVKEFIQQRKQLQIDIIYNRNRSVNTKRGVHLAKYDALPFLQRQIMFANKTKSEHDFISK